ADVAVLWSRGSGLSASQAQEGINLFAAKNGWARMSSVRVLGDGFDLSWDVPSPSRDRRRALGGREPAPAPATATLGPKPPHRGPPHREPSHGERARREPLRRELLHGEPVRREPPRRQPPDLGVSL
ncbi:MAG TPA: hypothetical protein VG184_01765, partial [Acidimicrobiales bacterium]|nr:hypothetical protein [Acidimicrobiales bacterium]